MKNPIVIAAVGGIVVATAIGLNFVLWRDDVPTRSRPVEQAATQAQSRAPGTPAKPKPEAKASDLTFDVVRVTPKGETVIAGRALPGATVVIMDGGKPLGEVVADNRGEWVFVPPTPLPPGSRELSLEMRQAGKPPSVSDSVVVLVVPDRDKDVAGRPSENGQALAVMMPRDGKGPSTVLQNPSGETTGGKLAIDSVDYDAKGDVTVSGRAAPNATVNLYLNNGFIGDAKTDAHGRWSVTPTKPIAPGTYKLRADQVDAGGKVAARVEIPFSRDAVAKLEPGRSIVVQPGNSLWRLARRTYGDGAQFTLIFDANKGNIQDPNLIYPGQVFHLPARERS